MLSKEYKEVCLKKNIPIDEDTGLIIFKSAALETTLKATKVSTSSGMVPTEEDMGRINSFAMEPQEPHEWMILHGVNPFGVASEPDIQGDKFSKEFQQHWVEAAPGTPILMDHEHSLAGIPPVGLVVHAYMDPKGPREDWAIPLEDYHLPIIKGIRKGTVRHVSIGVLVRPENKVCSSCKTSIASYSCPHEPGQTDEYGKPVTVIIKDFERLIERSLVNAPAREKTNLGKNITNEVRDTGAPEPPAIVTKAFYPDFCKSEFEFKVLKAMIENPGFYKQLPLVQARVDDLIPTQAGTNEDKVKDFVEAGNFDGGFGVLRGGTNFLLDGYHRLIAAQKENKSTIWLHSLSLPDGALKTYEEFGETAELPALAFKDITEKAIDVGTLDIVGVDKNLGAATISLVNQSLELKDSTVAKDAVKTETPTKVDQNHGDADPAKYEEIKSPGVEAKSVDETTKATEEDECMKDVEKSADKEPDEDDMTDEKDLSNVVTEDPTRLRVKDLSAQSGGDPTSLKEEKSLKVETSLSKDSTLTIKSLITSNKDLMEKAVKLFVVVEEQKSIMLKQSEMIEVLTANVDKVCKAVEEANKSSADDLLEKVFEVANQMVELEKEGALVKKSINQSGTPDLTSFLLSQYGQGVN